MGEYLLCETSKGVLSLKNDNGQLVYEMKNHNGKTFSYASSGPSYQGFQYNHYSRFQTDYLNVSFSQSGFNYIIFSNYEDNINAKGIKVINVKSKKEYTYQCNNEGVDNLSDLTTKLQCNKDSALGC